ncbi:MAG: helix-hairpin-helix domain-containing protein [Bacteroidota bacterium]|nr:helix-hairpin-helix domain-containing protein [Bacteroidota bacterium]
MFWDKFRKYDKSEQRAIVILIVTITVLQLGFYFFTQNKTLPAVNQAKDNWLSNQLWIDSIKNIKSNTSTEIKPFNPNYITDFKGYQLGLQPQEIDRLLTFRAQGKFVNTIEEFQQITQVSDSVLDKISPYFKFPNFINTNQNFQPKQHKPNHNKATITSKTDINHATQDDFIKIKGIGKVLSERIIKYKNLLGGFVSMQQLYEVYGLDENVIQEINNYFEIKDLNNIQKININTLSSKELAQFRYFNQKQAQEIVAYRSANGNIQGKDDLLKISHFPIDKIDIILVYLDF